MAMFSIFGILGAILAGLTTGAAVLLVLALKRKKR